MLRGLLLKSKRDARASLAQVIALIVIVALGIASFTALLGAYRDLSTSYNHTYDQLHFADVTFTLQQGDDSAVQAVRNIEGVQGVTGRLIFDTGFVLPPQDGSGDEQVRSRLIGIPGGERPEVNDVLVLEGDYFQDGNGNGQVLLETHFAEFYGIKPGDTVTPLVGGSAVPLEVDGVVASPEYLVVSPSKQDVLPSPRTFAVLFVPLGELQNLTGSGGAINDIAVTFSPGADGDQTVQRIRDKLQPYGVIEATPREDQPSFAALKLDLDGYREIAMLMPGLILLVAAASVYIMLSRHVRAQQQQIGVMKAIGYSNRLIVFHYLTLAFFIGLAGSAIGILTGIPLEDWVTGYYAQELGIPLVQTEFHTDLVLTGVGLSLLISLLAGLGPSLGITRLAPAQAMHTDPASALVKGRATLIERILPLPFDLRFPRRSVFRVRRRSLSTGLGVVCAFIRGRMCWGMIDSMEYLLDHTFDDVEKWDMQATFNEPQGAETLKTIEAWQGVDKAEPFVQMPVELSAGGVQAAVLLNAFSPSETLHKLEFKSDVSQEEALGEDKIILTTAMASKLKLGPGDEVSVSSPQGSHKLTVSAITPELMGSVAYISLSQAGKLTGLPDTDFNAIYVNTDSARTDAVQANLTALPGAAGVQLKSGIKDDWQSLMGLFYAFMGVIMAFAAVMAFALLFNTMTVNVLEQQREFATMRAIGASRGRIAMFMATENLILWLLALAPGLVLGWLVAIQMGKAFESDLFTFEIFIKPSSYIITAVGILATMIIAALPAIRRINRLDLAEATKILT